MADEMNDYPSASGVDFEKSSERPVAEVTAAMNELPTLQRNALRKIFDCPHFLPDEVAALGYRRLQQAEGIGTKGLAAITDWLKLHGHELQAPTLPMERQAAVPKKSRRTIEMAVRLLRTHGYEVQPISKSASRANGRER